MANEALGDWVLAGSISALTDAGEGLRFDLPGIGQRKDGSQQTEPAFVIQADGHVYGYLNRCGHVPVELDWPEGQFFDDGAVFIVCATHGATYSPQSGACLGGPCAGRGLVKLDIKIEQDQIWARLPTSA
ncbi:MAG: Rieske (2Fe-2S) protein [Burkholderiaceae bacterium]